MESLAEEQFDPDKTFEVLVCSLNFLAMHGQYNNRARELYYKEGVHSPAQADVCDRARDLVVKTFQDSAEIIASFGS